MPLSNFSYSDYVLFIYLCIANVDNDLSLEEIEVLFDKMDLEHFNNSNSELLVGVVYKKYKSIPPEQRLEAIQISAHKHLADKQKGLNLLQNLYQIMIADGEIKPSEKKLFEEIEAIVNPITYPN
jgi:uncharacterized tellurite resistance protein B-like protein